MRFRTLLEEPWFLRLLLIAAMTGCVTLAFVLGADLSSKSFCYTSL